MQSQLQTHTQSQPQTQRPRRHTLPMPQAPCPSPLPQIPNLFTQLTQNFHLLQQSYLTAHTKQQQSLLNSFIKTFNEILNQVVQAQERVYLINCQDIKDDKCIGYLGQIAIYREECMRNKAKLRDRIDMLEKERERTGKIGGEARQLGVLCRKKGEELERIRGQVERQQEKIRQKGEKDIPSILQNIQKQQQNPQKSKQYFSNPKRAISKTSRSTRIREQILTNKQLNLKLKLNLNINSSTPNKSPNPNKPKSIDSKYHQKSPIHSTLFSHRLQNNGYKKLDSKINQQDLLNISTMNDTLWLYKPASIRKNKYLKEDVKSTTLSILEGMKKKNQENKRIGKRNENKPKEEDCLFEQVQSQQSTKKDSQMIKSQIQQTS